MTTVKELLEKESFFDFSIVRHGFTDYMRDYEIIVNFGHHSGNALCKYQFIGCVETQYALKLPPLVFAQSISDEFVYSGPDYPDKEVPAGFIWGVRYAEAYPGLTYIEQGVRAKFWSAKIGRKMHEVNIETNTFELQLVFADVRVALMGHVPEVSLLKDYPLPVTEATSDGGV
jgi:hypothetical protein